MARNGTGRKGNSEPHDGEPPNAGPPRKRTVKDAPGRGDNSNGDLTRYVDRLVKIQENINEERESFNAVLVEAMERGLNKKALRAIVKRRLESDEEKATRLDMEASFDDYLSRLGMLSDLPLGLAAASAEFPDRASDAPPI